MSLQHGIQSQKLFYWVLALACCAVGIKNFEIGLKIDGLLYSAISRTIARTGEWFLLSANTSDFQPFAEHPHLGFWTQALVFKLLPAADWSARIPGHLYYAAFLFLFFRFVEKVSQSTKQATLACLILWSFGSFSNFFSDAYLDPGTLFWGTLCVYLLHIASSRKMIALAGFSLALCTLQKGLSVLGFFPIVAYLFFKHKRNPTFFLIAFFTPLTLYYLAIKQSSVPQFFEIYWSRQFSNRFAEQGSLWNLFNSDFWLTLCQDTYYLFPLCVLSFFQSQQKIKGLLIPYILFFSFILLYAPNNRIGYQYWLMILPWIAWVLAQLLEPKLSISHTTLQQWSLRIAITAVLILQYLPIPINKRGQPPEIPPLIELKHTNKVNELILETDPGAWDFGSAGAFSWYADIHVSHATLDEFPVASFRKAILLRKADASQFKKYLEPKGWCLHQKWSHSSLWIHCPI